MELVGYSRSTYNSRFCGTPTCDRQMDRLTDRHSHIAYTAVAERRAVKAYDTKCTQFQ